MRATVRSHRRSTGPLAGGFRCPPIDGRVRAAGTGRDQRSDRGEVVWWSGPCSGRWSWFGGDGLVRVRVCSLTWTVTGSASGRGGPAGRAACEPRRRPSAQCQRTVLVNAASEQVWRQCRTADRTTAGIGTRTTSPTRATCAGRTRGGRAEHPGGRGGLHGDPVGLARWMAPAARRATSARNDSNRFVMAWSCRLEQGLTDARVRRDQGRSG